VAFRLKDLLPIVLPVRVRIYLDSDFEELLLERAVIVMESVIEIITIKLQMNRSFRAVTITQMRQLD
jgi:hypothetical protein